MPKCRGGSFSCTYFEAAPFTLSLCCVVQVRAVVQMAVKYARDGYTFDPLKEKKQKEALERRKAEEVRRALLFIPCIDAISDRVCILLFADPPLIPIILLSTTAHSYPTPAPANVVDPQGKRKAYEERMARKAKREGKELGYYLAVGADPPSVEELQQLRSMVRGCRVQIRRRGRPHPPTPLVDE